MLVPSIISAVSAILFGALTYHPYQDHLKLHGRQASGKAASADTLTSLNLDSCHSIFARDIRTPATPAEASYCDDVTLHRQSGMAYFSCDPSRLTWDARAGIWDDDLVGAQPGQQGVGAIWAWDTTKSRHPRQMFISFPPPSAEEQAPADLHTSFHPLGLAVTVPHPYYLPDNLRAANESESIEVPAVVVLVANHPRPRKSGVIDVFVHDLDGVGGRDNTVLRWIKRIEGEQLMGIDDEERTPTIEINPFRIAVFDEQHSASIPRLSPPTADSDADEKLSDAESARRHIRIPSFFMTSLPTANQLATDDGRASSAVFTSYMDYVRALLQPSQLKDMDGPAERVWLHHASVSQTVPVRMDGGRVDAWTGLPPLIQAWDANGERGASNSSASSLFLSRVDTNRAGFSEWEQHWVRGISFGITPHEVNADKEGTVKRLINTYTPSFVSFWKKPMSFPLRALAVDAIGRVWTAGTPDTLATEAWIEHRRNEQRRQLGSTRHRSQPAAGEFSSAPPRPASQIDQTTFLYRPVAGTPLHPWDTEKLERLKRNGYFTKKEFYTSPVFRQRAETEAELESSTGDDVEKGKTFLPTVPTAMAVDHERGFVIVAGAYDERGVAKCSIPQGWAEK
ncbi:uncharacterized protein PFL1_00201 [Pseudozyma flocculosa PF-1]|uniref:Uncharacterized protein n=1 Tax=Pseudozyma flocculosa TaxID=84751 RepID=A0A5C3ERX7_9BASI|nr:uncharacterized protein PFL1_00201 [Pseudozyma flocculosa PF-1]EPQ32003.1 hypothetical protein PFL1_00201 [Pseudozyma flocculosa PF-1]SPO35073.1 uncharacterized protein PSFLO_00544 [Pseudozyma flocculosa]